MTDIKRIERFPAGVVTLPPSKSISHRALICAGLAALGGGESRLENLGASRDVDASRRCMAALGAAFTSAEGGVQVGAGIPDENAVLDCDESGSTLRFLLPVAALDGRSHSFTGGGRLLARPLEPYKGVFQKAGVAFAADENAVTVQGPLKGGRYSLPGDVSSQFISGLLLALPLAQGNSMLRLTTPLESSAYVRMTLKVMEAFGVKVHWPKADSFEIEGGQRYSGAAYTVEGDYSQAAFFLAAGALGQPVGCVGLRRQSSQGDAAITELMQRMGAALRWKGDALYAVRQGPPRALDVDVREIPDLVPPLAALCCFAQGTSHITGAGRLRLKESDRLDALAQELARLGADIRQDADSLTITGRNRLEGGRADAHGDHRIAMALAVAAIGCRGPVELGGWQHVDKSYPAFWQDFEREARHG